MKEPIIWCADIGSVKNKKFGWCRATKMEHKVEVITGIEIEDFAKGIAEDLSRGNEIALGFECPLFVPISENPIQLTSARNGRR